MKKAIQLYSVYKACEQDLEQTLRKVHEMGYQGVEFAGFYGNSPYDIAKWLKRYYLETASMHYSADDLCDHADEYIELGEILGCNQMIICWHEMETRQDVEILAKRILAVTDQYDAHGMKIGYHNHRHEFHKDGSECLLDLLMEQTEGRMLLEPDVYWVYRGGQEPMDYMRRYASLIQCFHFKDGDAEHGMPAGTGVVPLGEIVDFAKSAGVDWAIVESEVSGAAEEQLEAVRKDGICLANRMG